MTNPYAIDGPALISFSGGRTSAYMLRQIMDAHGGRLPDDVHVTFANTGRERNETLDFVAEVERRWSVPIVWLEWRDNRDGGSRFNVVSHNSASRDGEPFERLIQRRNCLPSPMRRFCTQELKLKTIAAYAKTELGFNSWAEVVGLRGDEPGRALRAMQSAKDNSRRILCPLYEAAVTERDVMAFWRRQDFDLNLRSYQGNCDLCFLKGAGKVSQIMRERPDLAEWWIEQENRIRHTKKAGQSLKFRDDRPDYAALLDFTQRQGVLPFNVFDDSSDCETGCTDQEPEMDLCNLRSRTGTND